MFVQTSFRQLYAEKDEVKEKIFADLKDNASFKNVFHDMEEDVDEIVPETEHESQTQSQGCLGPSSRKAQLLARRNLSGTAGGQGSQTHNKVDSYSLE